MDGETDGDGGGDGWDGADGAPSADGGDGSGAGNEAAETAADEAAASLDSSSVLMMVIAIFVVITIVIAGTLAGYARHQEMQVQGGLRLDIYEYIRHNPGEHLSGIMEEFDISPSTAQHHLHILEQQSHVVAYKEQKFKRFYINGDAYKAQLPDTPYKSTIAALKNPTAHKIVSHLVSHPGASQKDVAGALGLSASTVNWHVNKLEEAGLVIKSRSGKQVIYTLKDTDIARKALAIAASEGGQA